MLEELVEWLTGSPGSAAGFRAVGQNDLISAIRERPGSFELFRGYHGADAHREFLSSLPYGESIHRAAEEQQIDSLLLAALVQAESNFNPEVISPVGAVGLAQLMPETGQSLTDGSLLDPQVNLEAGARYLSGLLSQFEGDLELALAAYNAGPGAVQRFGGIPPYRETQNYVKKVLGIYINHHQRVWANSGDSDLVALR